MSKERYTPTEILEKLFKNLGVKFVTVNDVARSPKFKRVK